MQTVNNSKHASFVFRILNSEFSEYVYYLVHSTQYTVHYTGQPQLFEHGTTFNESYLRCGTRHHLFCCPLSFFVWSRSMHTSKSADKNWICHNHADFVVNYVGGSEAARLISFGVSASIYTHLPWPLGAVLIHDSIRQAWIYHSTKFQICNSRPLQSFGHNERHW